MWGEGDKETNCSLRQINDKVQEEEEEKKRKENFEKRECKGLTRANGSQSGSHTSRGELLWSLYLFFFLLR